MKKAIYFGATWCGQRKVFKPKFEDECKRLGIDYDVSAGKPTISIVG